MTSNKIVIRGKGSSKVNHARHQYGEISRFAQESDSKYQEHKTRLPTQVEEKKGKSETGQVWLIVTNPGIQQRMQ